MKKTLLSLIIIVLIASCSKKEVDIRDQYVGTWKFKTTGAIITYNNGQIAESLLVSDEGTLTISKSGENGLLIDGKEFTLEGDQLTSDPEEIAFSTPQQAYVVAKAKTTSGSVSPNKILHKSSVEGTWTYGSLRGPVQGEVLVTMSK
ncbi:hypothetical protein [Dyadobacter sp. 32]|uniref:hypothetical protein n=1 Tax=Dyadobacter sp. 32 TaxID=538966 RepID=UPI0011EFADA8